MGVASSMLLANRNNQGKTGAMSGAQVYHDGGMVSKLGPREVPIIAEEGEGIISRKQMKNGMGNVYNLYITGNTIMNDRDTDKLGELWVRRLRTLGVST